MADYQLEPYEDEWAIAYKLAKLIAVSGELKPEPTPESFIPFQKAQQTDEEIADMLTQAFRRRNGS